jgi:hypothetical protein
MRRICWNTLIERVLLLEAQEGQDLNWGRYEMEVVPGGDCFGAW